MWGVKKNTWKSDNANERLWPLPPSKYSERVSSRWNTDNSPRNKKKDEHEHEEEPISRQNTWKSENINGTLWRSFKFSENTDDNKNDEEENEEGPLSMCSCSYHTSSSRPSIMLPPRKAPMHYHVENVKEIIDEDRKANSSQKANSKAQDIRHEREEEIKETISNIQKEVHSNLQKRVIISVPHTKVSVIMEAGKNPIVVNTMNNQPTQLSNFEHLFQYGFLQEWFYEFYSNKDAVLQFREDESSCSSTTVISKSFTPTHAFQWHAFCGNLSCNVQSGTFTTEKDDSLSLPLLLLDEKDLLREACARQFQDFIRKELSPYL
jgi:hypothetical protein